MTTKKDGTPDRRRKENRELEPGRESRHPPTEKTPAEKVPSHTNPHPTLGEFQVTDVAVVNGPITVLGRQLRSFHLDKKDARGAGNMAVVVEHISESDIGVAVKVPDKGSIFFPWSSVLWVRHAGG